MGFQGTKTSRSVWISGSICLHLLTGVFTGTVRFKATLGRNLRSLTFRGKDVDPKAPRQLTKRFCKKGGRWHRLQGPACTEAWRANADLRRGWGRAGEPASPGEHGCDTGSLWASSHLIIVCIHPIAPSTAENS